MESAAAASKSSSLSGKRKRPSEDATELAPLPPHLTADPVSKLTVALSEASAVAMAQFAAAQPTCASCGCALGGSTCARCMSAMDPAAAGSVAGATSSVAASAAATPPLATTPGNDDDRTVVPAPVFAAASSPAPNGLSRAVSRLRAAFASQGPLDRAARAGTGSLSSFATGPGNAADDDFGGSLLRPAEHPLGPFARLWVLNPYSAVTGGSGPDVDLATLSPALRAAAGLPALPAAAAGSSAGAGTSTAGPARPLRLGGVLLPLVDPAADAMFAAAEGAAPETSSHAQHRLLRRHLTATARAAALPLHPADAAAACWASADVDAVVTPSAAIVDGLRRLAAASSGSELLPPALAPGVKGALWHGMRESPPSQAQAAQAPLPASQVPGLQAPLQPPTAGPYSARSMPPPPTMQLAPPPPPHAAARAYAPPARAGAPVSGWGPPVATSAPSGHRQYGQTHPPPPPLSRPSARTFETR